MTLPEFFAPNIIIQPPGPIAQRILEKEKKHLYVSKYPTNIVASEARGCTIKDVDGNTYIDFSSGTAVSNIGHCHPKVVAAIKRQAEKISHLGSQLHYELTINLARMLGNIAPGELKRVFFSNSGTEATEAALKVSRAFTKKPMIISFLGAFHGRSLGALSVTANKAKIIKHYSPLMPGIQYVPYPYCYRCYMGQTYPDCNLLCVEYIERVLETIAPPEDVSSLIIEPIQGESGCIVPPRRFLEKIRKICSDHRFILIIDEVQTGFGRTGKMFATEHYGVNPDIMTVAKAIAGGIPLGATLTRKEIMDVLESGSHGSTFGGNAVACAAAIANLDVIKGERLVENSAKLGKYALKRLRDIECKIVGDIRGKGLLMGIELVKNKKKKTPAKEEARKVIIECAKKGLVVSGGGTYDNIVRIIPPLSIQENLLDKGIDILEETLQQLK